MDNKNSTYNDLLKSIEHWNEYRVPILRISQPDKNLNFQGAMRFYFQDSGQKVATKCVNVTSADSTKEVIDVLIEKFRPDMRMLSVPEYGLYEIHENGDERKLDLNERPLYVQLEWNKDDREGRFLLRRMDEKTRDLAAQTEEPSLKRKLSKKEKKKQDKLKKQQQKEQEKADAAANKAAAKGKNGIAERLYNELPETSFTRSISNPEAVMKRRRAQKLEKRLHEFSVDGGQGAGGTLRIFGETINKDVSYKTLLLSTKDTAVSVVKQILEKYGKEDEDPQNYCLVQLIVPPSAASGDNNSVHDLNTSSALRESILDDTDCPLLINQTHDQSKGVLTFHIRHKPADWHKRKKKKQPLKNQQNPLHPLVVQQLNQRIQMNAIGNHGMNNNSDQYRDQNSPQNSSQTSGSLSHDINNPPPPPFETVHSMPTMFPQQNNGNLMTYQQPMNQQMIHPQSMSTSTLPRRIPGTNGHDIGGTMQRQNYNHQNMMGNHQNKQFQANKMMPNSQYPIQQQVMQQYAPATGANDQILPALIQVKEDVEDLFLSRVITHIKPTDTTFRLAPTYVLYMVSRYRASTLFHPELQAPKRAELFVPFTKKIAAIIREAIEIHAREPTFLAFWLANSSDLSHFYKQDKHLSHFTIEAQEILYESIKASFKYLLACKQLELDQVLHSFFDNQDEHDGPMMTRSNASNGMTSSVNQILDVLNDTMSTMRKNRVNAALTIQIFSHLFHHISKWLFDRLIGFYDRQTNMLTGQANFATYCNRAWGERLGVRLAMINKWAEKQGLEQAAEFHLARVTQITQFLTKVYPPKITPLDVKEACDSCDRLNPVQLRALLQRYQPDPQNYSTLSAIIQHILYTMDYSYIAGEYPLEEDFELRIPFLIPDDGYSSDMIRYIPQGLLDFISYLSKIRVRDQELCIFTVQPTSSGHWTVYFKNHQPDMPDIIVIQLRKKNSSMGLSIIAAQGVGQDHQGIYIKNVVKDGAAALDGRLQAGDQLLEVDGNSLQDINQDIAARLMQQTGPVVTLKIAKQAAIYHHLLDIINRVPSETVVSPQVGAGVPPYVPPAPLEPPPPMHQQIPIMHDRDSLVVQQLPQQQMVHGQQTVDRSQQQPLPPLPTSMHPMDIHSPRVVQFQQPIQPQQLHHQTLSNTHHIDRLVQPIAQEQQPQRQVHFQPPPPAVTFEDQQTSPTVANPTSPLKSPKKVSWVDTQPHQSLHTLIPPSPQLAPSPAPQIPSPLPESQANISDQQQLLQHRGQNGSELFQKYPNQVYDNGNLQPQELGTNGHQMQHRRPNYDEDDDDDDDDEDDEDDDDEDDDDEGPDVDLTRQNSNQQMVISNGQMIDTQNVVNNNNNINSHDVDDHQQQQHQMTAANGTSQLDTTAESLTLEDIDEVLSSKTHNNWLEDSAGVIGTQEVYNDPRQRIVKAREQTNADVNIEKLSFQEKLKMFNISAKK